MYPVIRLSKEILKFRNAAKLPLNGVHVSRHMCLPWDLDLWMELNNGRTLTLYDLGRIVLARRIGLIGALRANGWGMTMAGATVRYRRRIRMFETVTMKSRALCWDERFIYIEQTMWSKDGECANHIVYRAAIVGPSGILAPAQIALAMGHTDLSPSIPEWVQHWITAEANRPWPPMQD